MAWIIAKSARTSHKNVPALLGGAGVGRLVRPGTAFAKLWHYRLPVFLRGEKWRLERFAEGNCRFWAYSERCASRLSRLVQSGMPLQDNGLIAAAAGGTGAATGAWGP